MDNLSVNLKESINGFCEKEYEIIKNDHPQIRSIISQYNKDQLFIGSASCGLYKTLYYNPQVLFDWIRYFLIYSILLGIKEWVVIPQTLLSYLLH